MEKILHAIGVAGFKGIGSNIQFVKDMQKINFFVGENNAGKSTILQYVSEYVGTSQSGSSNGRLLDAHVHRGRSHASHRSLRGLPWERFKQQALGMARSQVSTSYGVNKDQSGQRMSALIDRLAPELAGDGYVWFEIKMNQAQPEAIFDQNRVSASLRDNEWGEMWKLLKPTWSGGDVRTWRHESLQLILKDPISSVPVAPIIPAVRRIGEQGGTFAGYGGIGIIDKLAKMQNPPYDRRIEKENFDKINGFLATVTGQEGAHIEIPYERDSILVHMNGKVLPTESLGTGIHEVILLATFCTITREKIVCIEEPELHLHPLLQRKLISYIENNTDNQYLIATHSAAFIDTPGAAIYHVVLENEETRISPAKLASERYRICSDLGYRASDIVQSNSIIWVEGPSDRIYIKHWIRSADPHLREGVHYSIMFYGGRSLSHLTAEDNAISDFISLRDLNRNVAVVIDSDRGASTEPINATKQRLVKEITSGGGFVWVTNGREIENYVDYSVLHAAIAEVHSKVYDAPSENGPYGHSLWFRRVANDDGRRLTEKTVDKVGVAHKVCEKEADLRILDLELRVSTLVALIRKANHIP